MAVARHDLHVIIDNRATYKYAKVKAGTGTASAGPLPLRAYLGVVPEPPCGRKRMGRAGEGLGIIGALNLLAMFASERCARHEIPRRNIARP
jgi:hypothetical protein